MRQISRLIATRRSSAAAAEASSPPKSSPSISSVSRRSAGRYSVSQRCRRPSMWSPITGMCALTMASISSGAPAGTGLL